MKYIITLSLLLTGFIIFISCNDSLGIEKNVLITTIDTNSHDTTGKDTIQKIPASIDSIQFYEEFLYDGMPYSFPINDLVIFQEAYVDTSRYPIFVWLRMNIKNKYGDEINQALGRKEYTQSISFIADSLQGPGGPFRLNGAPNSSYWSEIGVRNIASKDSTFLSGSASSFEIRFLFDFKNHITAIIYAKIPNPEEPGNDTYVSGSLIIKYPK